MKQYDELWGLLSPSKTMVTLTAVVAPQGRIERLEISGRSPASGEILDLEFPSLGREVSYHDLLRAAHLWVLLLDANTDDS